MDENYVLVRFEGNNSMRWEGKETEVPGRTVVRLGSRGVDGLEKAEVHWGKGKGKKVWKCVMLEGGARGRGGGGGAAEEVALLQPQPWPQQRTTCRRDRTAKRPYANTPLAPEPRAGRG